MFLLKRLISSLVIELSPRLLDCLPLGSSGAGAGPDVMVSPGSMDSQSWSPSNPGLQRQHLEVVVGIEGEEPPKVCQTES